MCIDGELFPYIILKKLGQYSDFIFLLHPTAVCFSHDQVHNILQGPDISDVPMRETVLHLANIYFLHISYRTLKHCALN